MQRAFDNGETGAPLVTRAGEVRRVAAALRADQNSLDGTEPGEAVPVFVLVGARARC